MPETRGRGRFLALRLGAMITLILAFGLLSQLVAVATVLGYVGPAYVVAALVLVNATAQIFTGARHQQRRARAGSARWIVRSTLQESILVSGLVAIGMGHTIAGWWAAIVYLLWTGSETALKYRRAEAVPRREARRIRERRWSEAEARLQHAEAAMELAESVMVGSRDDEDAQAAAQQLRHAAGQARQGALEGLRDTHSAELQIRERNRARLRAALDDLEHSRPHGPGPRQAQPSDPWDTGPADRWSSL